MGEELEWRFSSSSRTSLPAPPKKRNRLPNGRIIELESSDLEDRLLDYIACLELVFLRDDKELGYKLKTSAAAFLTDKMGEACEVRLGSELLSVQRLPREF